MPTAKIRLDWVAVLEKLCELSAKAGSSSKQQFVKAVLEDHVNKALESIFLKPAGGGGDKKDAKISYQVKGALLDFIKTLGPHLAGTEMLNKYVDYATLEFANDKVSNLRLWLLRTLLAVKKDWVANDTWQRVQDCPVMNDPSKADPNEVW